MSGRPPADVVVLAAGRSSRMGVPKGLFPFEGRPWLLTQLSALASRRVVLVLGHDAPRYDEAIPDLAARVDVAVNPDPDRGPFSSLQTGLARLPPDGRPAFVLPDFVARDDAPHAIHGRDLRAGHAVRPHQRGGVVRHESFRRAGERRTSPVS